MSSIQVAQLGMGYSPYHSGEGHCPDCRHSQQQDGLRCDKGGYWVKATGGCNEFDAKGGQAPKVQIGPTDI